jgi:LPS sulfotransferase NodH
MTTAGTRRHELTKSQAQLLAEIEARRRAVVREWDVALALVGIDPSKIVGGNLDKDPHFIVSDDI